MDDAAAMGEAEGAGDVGGEVGGQVGVERPVGLDGLPQAAALDVLHDDEVRAVFLAPVEDGHDVGVVEVGGGLGLPPEPLHEGRVAGELGEQHLERDAAVEELVVGQVDLGHPAPGQVPDDFVPVRVDPFGHRRHPTVRRLGGRLSSK